MRIFGLTITRKSPAADDSDTVPLRKRVQRLEIAFEELQEAHTQLHGAHAKLRNQFHGSKGGRPTEAEKPRSVDEVPVGDKVALRAAVGLFPGRARVP